MLVDENGNAPFPGMLGYKQPQVMAQPQTQSQPQIRYNGMFDGPGSQGNGPGITALQSRPIAQPQAQPQQRRQYPAGYQNFLKQFMQRHAQLQQNRPQGNISVNQQQGNFPFPGVIQAANGGRISYADGSQPKISKQQIAMAITMLKKGADLDTIASMTGIPSQTIQTIISKVQQGIQQKAPGGISGLKTGGIPEIDYRDKGGYVPPIGKKERADDIPAMLSNNEFVFTANAVRNAGGGDVKAGAKKMYALMKKLEKGMA
jgi:hypothetical protein